MITTFDYTDGEEWQSFVIRLLSLRYGAGLIEVPDAHGGDRGIEAFATTDGCAFQCYAPEPPANISEIAAKHKRKISSDIKKFRENKEDLKQLFGSTKIKNWILVVPNHCSAEVVGWCQQKTAEIRNLKPQLPYVTEDFQVLVVSGHTFLAVEVKEFSRVGALLEEADLGKVEQAQIHEFSDDNDEWMANLNNKLRVLPTITNEKERTELKDMLLREHLKGENAISYYDGKFPLIADEVRSIKQSRATALEIESKLKALTISGTTEQFENELIFSVPALGKQTALTLSYAAVTEWLMVCPLNPKG